MARLNGCSPTNTKTVLRSDDLLVLKRKKKEVSYGTSLMHVPAIILTVA